MVRIIVVCGAGASSTFVAHRIRRAASTGDSRSRANATSESQLDAALDDADVLLVGAHLVDRIGQLRERAAAASVPFAILTSERGRRPRRRGRPRPRPRVRWGGVMNRRAARAAVPTAVARGLW